MSIERLSQVNNWRNIFLQNFEPHSKEGAAEIVREILISGGTGGSPNGIGESKTPIDPDLFNTIEGLHGDLIQTFIHNELTYQRGESIEDILKVYIFFMRNTFTPNMQSLTLGLSIFGKLVFLGKTIEASAILEGLLKNHPDEFLSYMDYIVYRGLLVTEVYRVIKPFLIKIDKKMLNGLCKMNSRDFMDSFKAAETEFIRDPNPKRDVLFYLNIGQQLGK